MPNLHHYPRMAAAFTTLATSVLFACGSTQASSLRGNVSLTPSLTFQTLTTTPSSPQSAILTNSSNGALHIRSIAIAGSAAADFTILPSQPDACPSVLPPGSSCAISISFASSAAVTASATLVVTHDDGPGGSLSTALTGTAVVPAPVVSFSSPSIAFAPITAGSTSPAQSVQLKNTGTAELDISGISIIGSGANLFTQTNTCGATLAVGASCTISTTFAPLVAGSYSASVSVADNAAGSPQTVTLTASATPAAITIDTSTASDWKISNGAVKIDWNSLRGNIYAITLAGHSDNLIDTTNTSGGLPKGFYMDNAGFGPSTPVAAYTNTGSYLDWSITYPSNSKNPYTYTEHFVVTPNDPGIHLYFTAVHSASDIAGSIGQVQWVFRDSLTQFTNTYAVDPSVNSPGPTLTPLPPSSEMFTTAPGRDVQDATVDLHGLPLPAGYAREFYTKYDFAGYEYLHKAHGLYGSIYGTWTVLPSTESLAGGPTKQNLDFTGNLLMVEAYSNHEDNGMTLKSPAGTASSRLFGPFYVHFNTFGQAYNATGNTLATPADMYKDALQAGASFVPFYDTEQQLLASGYVPSSGRGSVSVQVAGVAGSAPKSAWAVLSDPGRNFQYSSSGYQYWADISSTGSANFTGVAPGTYRLSVYVLGKWGELRKESIVVNAGQPTTVPSLTFVPENFAPTQPLFTIGIPDRSSHEFLHGHNAKGFDDREYWGAWNYWEDFQNNQGAVVYNATAGPTGAATNDLSQWNYDHWGVFDPGLYAGVYNSSDQTKDGYQYAIPTYVVSLPKAAGTNGVSTRTPPWLVHFATPASQSSGTPANYVVLSAAFSCAEGSYVVSLNGQQLIWHEKNASDCMLRSGLSGYTQWVAFQWDASVLNPSGQDNLLTIGVSQYGGVSDDALRLELTNTSADPATRNWNDYEFVYKSTDVQANDTLPNP